MRFADQFQILAFWQKLKRAGFGQPSLGQQAYREYKASHHEPMHGGSGMCGAGILGCINIWRTDQIFQLETMMSRFVPGLITPRPRPRSFTLGGLNSPSSLLPRSWSGFYSSVWDEVYSAVGKRVDHAFQNGSERSILLSCIRWWGLRWLQGSIGTDAGIQIGKQALLAWYDALESTIIRSYTSCRHEDLELWVVSQLEQMSFAIWRFRR